MTDLRRLFRFAIVGTGVSIFYVLSYVLLVRLGYSLWWANVTAFLSAVLVQYVAQSFWTFRKPLAVPAQIGRFLTMIGVGLGVSIVITSFAAPRLSLSEWLAAGLVAVILPFINYVILSLWVFDTKKV